MPKERRTEKGRNGMTYEERERAAVEIVNILADGRTTYSDAISILRLARNEVEKQKAEEGKL